MHNATARALIRDLQSCTVYAILSESMGSPQIASSYNVGSGVLGFCALGMWNPTSNMVTSVVRRGCMGNESQDECTRTTIQTFHAGNLTLSLAAHVSAGVEFGGDVNFNASVGGSKVWYR